MALGADREKGGVMADTWNPTTANGGNPTLQQIFANNNQQYLGRAASGAKSAADYRAVGNTGALVTGTFGTAAQKVGLSNLLQMLLQQGRVDPRLLATAQAQNSRSTQQQQDAARAGAARRGLGGGGMSDALQAAIGSAGANRSANLNYQDIADSYQRNQENLGLVNQLVTQPQLGYASLGVQDTISNRDAFEKKRAAALGFLGSLGGSLGKGFGG